MKINILPSILAATVTALSGSQLVNAAENGKGFELEEVVVTARKREENLQDTPISVTAVSGNLLKEMGIAQISGVADVAPNVNFSFAGTTSGSGSAAVIYIRGVGQNDFSPTTDPGVGVYVDGVYLARTVGSVLDLVDVERVEVLRGPQGTLFGRNTIGGAINVITRDPSDEFSGDIQAIVGEDNRKELLGSVSVPISDNAGLILSGLIRKQDGTVDRLLDGEEMGDDDVWGLRGKLAWDVTDDLSVKFAADYVKEDEGSAAEVLTDAVEESGFGAFFNNNTFGNGSTDAEGCAGGGATSNPACFNDQFVAGPHTSYETGPNKNKIANWGLSLEAIYAINDSLELKSITAYRDLEATFSRSSDGSPFLIFETTDDYASDQFSQELQLIGSGDIFDWVAGVYYFKEDAKDITFADSVVNVAFPRLVGGEVENKNWAVYGEGTYHISDALHLTGGLRFTEDTKNYLPSSFIIPQGVSAITAAQQPELSWEEVTGRISLGWDVSEELTTYFTVSEGFKSGGYDFRILSSTPDDLAPTYDPEYVTLYELGVKGEFEDIGLRFSFAYFQSDYEDIQTSSNPPGSAATVTFNATDGEIDGYEAEFQWVPTNSLLIQGAFGYMQAEYGDTGTALVTSNDDFIRTPELSWNIGASYIVSLDDAGTLTPRFDLVYKDEVHFEPVNDEDVMADEYTALNIRVAWEDSSEKTKVTFGINNVTDEEYIVAGDSNDVLGYALVVYARERNAYLSIDYVF